MTASAVGREGDDAGVGDGEGAGGVGVGHDGAEVGVGERVYALSGTEELGEESGDEGVAGADSVYHFDLKPRDLTAGGGRCDSSSLPRPA